VVPFWISNAPSVFMCLMNGIFHNYLETFVTVILDELFYSKFEEEHKQHLMMVLQVLREH